MEQVSKDFFSIELTVKGNISILDPKSKLLTTLVIVIGIAVSIDFFQVVFFAILLLPLWILYRPNFSIIKRLITFLPLIIFISTIMFFTFKDDITLHIWKYQRTYTPIKFVIFNGFRFLISITHSSLLIESETSTTEIIEALASFKFLQNVVSILHLINRLITRLQMDYSKMIMSAETRGYLNTSTFSRLFFKLRVMSRLLTKATEYSESIGDTLTARGFSQHGFTSSSRGWSSEGMTVLVLATLSAILFASLPLWVI